MSLSTEARQVLACVISVIYMREVFRLRMAAAHPAARVVARNQCTNSVVTSCRLLTNVAAASLCACILIILLLHLVELLTCFALQFILPYAVCLLSFRSTESPGQPRWDRSVQ